MANDHEDNAIILTDDTADAAHPAAEQKQAGVAAAAIVAPEPEVILAPVAHGRSFVLRSFFNSQVRTGQMLVFAAKNVRDAAIEVLETHLITPSPGKSTDKQDRRFYLGDRKAPAGYWPLIFEMRVSFMPGGKKAMEYRLLYPSGKMLRSWAPLDLGVLKLKTSDEQRAVISAFTGIIYKLREQASPKQTHQPERRRDDGERRQPRPLDNMFSRAGTSPSQVKHKLQQTPRNQPKHDTVRRDLQRGLQPAPKPEAVLPAGESAHGAAAPEAASTEPAAPKE